MKESCLLLAGGLTLVAVVASCASLAPAETLQSVRVSGRDCRPTDYLETTGTQYVLLGRKLTPDTRMVYDVELTDSADGTRLDGQTGLCGVASGSTVFVHGFKKSEGVVKVVMGDSWNSGATGAMSSVRGRHVLDLRSGYQALDGVQFGSLTLPKTLKAPELALFGTREDAACKYRQKIRLYGFKLYEGDRLCLDLVPYENGTSGFLYDKVTGAWLANAGCDEFVFRRPDGGQGMDGIVWCGVSIVTNGTDLIVSCGTDDYASGVPLGDWYETTHVCVNKNGSPVLVDRRTPKSDDATYRGRLNRLLNCLKRECPERDIVLVPPTAGREPNVTNGIGLVCSDYATVVREAGNVWAVRVSDRAEAVGDENDCAGRRVAFLGDSITDKQHIGCTSNYWNFLARDLKLVPLVYGINGHQWNHVYRQAERLFAEHPSDIDEIVVFAGTNDYNANVPLGAWSDDDATFRGRIAKVMGYLMAHYPTAAIWLLTPIHRGYAEFGAMNVQPDERHANTAGLWIDDYVAVIKEAAARWGAARLIDLNAESGLFPLFDSHMRYFHDPYTDRLHPNTAGHERMAKAIARHMRTADAAKLVQAQIDALPPEGGTVRLSRGTYHFHESSARTMWLNPSNNKSGEKRVVFPLVGRRNVTIDGCGSTFVFHGRTFPFAATNCTDLVFRNFTVTTRYPSCAGFVVTEKSDAGFTVKFDRGVCPYEVKDGHLTFFLDGHEISTRKGCFSLHALDRVVIRYLFTPGCPSDKSALAAGFVGAKPEIVGDRTVRFIYYGDKHAKSVKLPYGVGEKVVVNLEGPRYRDVFFFEDCDGVVVENVTIRRFGGMGVVGQRSGNIRIDRLNALSPDGERVTLTADIVQFINCFGDIVVVNCAGGHSLDDWINIHGNYLKADSVEGSRVRLRTGHDQQSGFFPYRPGDAMEFVTPRERRVVAKANVLSWTADPADGRTCEVTVDANLSSAGVVGLLVENVTLNPNVTICHNHFVDYPNLRLSGRGKYVIENNYFECCGSAVIGMDLADYWFESGRIEDMSIRNNVVSRGTGFLFGLPGWSGHEPDLPKIHGRILLEGNRFETMYGPEWSAVGVREFIVNP